MGFIQINALRTPLYGVHKRLGARMTVFSGWEMPVEYSGILEEHRAVRRSIGLFDVSHMNKLEVSGQGTEEFLQRISTNDISKLKLDMVKYTILCRDDGTVVDDVLVLKMLDYYMLVTNAGRKEVLMPWLEEHKPGGINIKDVTLNLACLALQGPKAEKTLTKIAGSLRNTSFFRGSQRRVSGIECYVTRSGYTGEDGFEIYVSKEHAEEIWDSIIEAGEEFDITPAGLGARDTLRLEMGYILTGMDMTSGDNPLEANLEWAIKWYKDFIGKEALLEIKRRGMKKKLVGLRLKEGIPRHGYTIADHRGNKIGMVTSGTISPCLGYGIALGYVDPAFSAPGTGVNVIIRGKPMRGEIVKLPFWEAKR